MKTPVVLAVALLAGVGIGWYLSGRFEKQGNSSAQSQQAIPAAEQVPAPSLSQAEREELERLRRGVPELLRLRNEVTRLRQQRETGKQGGAVQIQSSITGRFMPTERLANVGFATPEAALISFMAGSTSGNFEQIMAAVRPLPDGQSIDKSEFEQGFRQEPRFIGMQIIAKKVLSDDKVDIQTLHFMEGRAPITIVHHMVKVGAEWRYSDSINPLVNWDREGQVQVFLPE